MNVLCNIVWRHIIEEVYDASLAGFLYDGMCSCFHMYVYTRM